jgi:hypothetical protein
MLNFRMTQKNSCYAAMLVALGLAMGACSQQSGAIIKVDLRKTSDGMAISYQKLEFYFSRVTKNNLNLRLGSGFRFNSTRDPVVRIREYQSNDVVKSDAISAAGSTYDLLLSDAVDGSSVIVVGFDDNNDAKAVGTIDSLTVTGSPLRLYPLSLTPADKIKVFGKGPSSCLVWNPSPSDPTIFVVTDGDFNCDEKQTPSCETTIVSVPTPPGEETCDGFDNSDDCKLNDDIKVGSCIQETNDTCVIGERSKCLDDSRSDPWQCESSQPLATCVSRTFCSARDVMARLGQRTPFPEMSVAIASRINMQLEADRIVCSVISGPLGICQSKFEVTRPNGADCGTWDMPGLFMADNSGGSDTCTWKFDPQGFPVMSFDASLMVKTKTSNGNQYLRENKVHFERSTLDDCNVMGGAAIKCTTNDDRDQQIIDNCD